MPSEHDSARLLRQRTPDIDGLASPPPAAAAYRRQRIDHWNSVARRATGATASGYHRRLQQIYRFLIPPGQRVLEIGSGTGHLLASLEPSQGIGVDFSPAMVESARRSYPELDFLCVDAMELSLDQEFDCIVLADVINDLWDVQAVFERVAALARPQTRIAMNFPSRLWEVPLAIASRLRLSTPLLEQNWLTVADVSNLAKLAGLEVLRSSPEVLSPFRLPLIDTICNRFLVKIWPFKVFAMTHILVARLDCSRDATRQGGPPQPPLRVSVIVPARNEAGNIGQIFERTPELGAGTELIFVEGHSSDDTFRTVERAIAEHPERRARLFRQTGRGKGDAVRLGFAEASGDVLMILDADLTVPPEDLVLFYRALHSGQGEFINGSRLIYPMEEQAMRFLNLLGNKFFSLAFSWLLGQPIKDTLCGTKVLRRGDYERIARGRSYFGDFDPFGDFDLIFGAAKLNLKMVDMPIRYRERTYGSTNIDRWRHGWLLLRMLLFACGKLKFV